MPSIMLDREKLDQYVQAGNIARDAMFITIDKVYNLQDPEHLDFIGPQIDDFIEKSVQQHFPDVKYKGCAQPTNLVGIYLPPTDVLPQSIMYKLCIGVHIGGNTALFSHTICPSAAKQKIDPSVIDAMSGAQFATEVVISLLGTALNGERVTGREIKYLVDQVAEEFDCMIFPVSSVRRQTPYNYGQAGTFNDAKVVTWSNPAQFLDFVVEGNEAWLVDLAFTKKGKLDSFEDVWMMDKMTSYPIFSVNYTSKTPIPPKLGEFFATLTKNPMPQRKCKFAASKEFDQCIALGLVIPWQYPALLQPCPRNTATTLLVNEKLSRTGKPTVLRLNGGTQFPLQIFGPRKDIKNEILKNLIRLKYADGHNLTFTELHGC